MQAQQYAFYFDARACSGCKACQVACKDKHGLPVGQLWRRVYEVTGGDWQAQGEAWLSGVFAYNLSIACNHCAQPVCKEVCPSGAIYQRPDGIVLIAVEKCLGCGYCQWACPYEAPQYDARTGRMGKCTLCADNLEAGLAPACVSACPLRALDFGEPQALQTRFQGVDSVFPLIDGKVTRPALLINPHPATIRAQMEGARLANQEETQAKKRPEAEQSLVLYTLLAQLAVGLFLALGVLYLLFASRLGAQLAGLTVNPLMLVTGPVIALSILASLFHLGSPRNAYRALANLRSSWLSREILFTLLFAGAWAALMGMQLLGKGSLALQSSLSALTALCGIGLVYCMGRIYRVRSIACWNSWTTWASFAITTGLLGCLAGGLALAFEARILSQIEAGSFALWQGLLSNGLLWLGAGALLCLGLQLLLLPAWKAQLFPSSESPTPASTLAKPRLALYLAALVILLAFLPLADFSPGALLSQTALLWLAFSLVLVAEIMGRMMFYAARSAPFYE